MSGRGGRRREKGMGERGLKLMYIITICAFTCLTGRDRGSISFQHLLFPICDFPHATSAQSVSGAQETQGSHGGGGVRGVCVCLCVFCEPKRPRVHMEGEESEVCACVCVCFVSPRDPGFTWRGRSQRCVRVFVCVL